MKMIKKRWLILMVALGAALLTVWQWKSKKNSEPRFQAVAVARGDIRVSILTTGLVQPRNRLEIKPPIAGRVEEVLVKEGQLVKKGELMAWMSSTERAALMDAARSQGPEALKRWEGLYKPAPLVAPLNGTIIARNVEPGQTITSQDAVLVMSDRLIVKAQVDETDIAQIHTGQAARVSLDAYAKDVIQAKVEHIAYEAKTVNNVTIYEVDVLPLELPDTMRSGMTANVTFDVASREGVLFLPVVAVRQEEGKATVLIPSGKDKKRPRTRPIETGLTDGKNIEILSGLEEGENVLASGLTLSSGKNSAGGSPLTPWGRPASGRRNR